MDIYHLCKEDPAHKAWGIYERPKTAKPTKPFQLNTIVFNFNGAKEQAEKLTGEFPKKDFSVQGATLSNNLPDQYQP